MVGLAETADEYAPAAGAKVIGNRAERAACFAAPCATDPLRHVAFPNALRHGRAICRAVPGGLRTGSRSQARPSARVRGHRGARPKDRLRTPVVSGAIRY